MIEAAGRSRLLELRRRLVTAREGRSLLDRKREAILRALTERLPAVDARHQSVSRALGEARGLLVEAQFESGRSAIDAAALAQPPLVAIEAAETTLVGVPLPRIRASVAPFAPRYGPIAVTSTLDRAGAAFTALVPEILRLAAEDAAVRRLRAALTRTVRRLNALDTIVLAELTHEIHVLGAALEEEERDEAVRRARWCQTSDPHRHEPADHHTGSTIL